MGSRSGKKREISIITYVGSLKRIRTEETVGNITVIRTEYKQQKQMNKTLIHYPLPQEVKRLHMYAAHTGIISG